MFHFRDDSELEAGVCLDATHQPGGATGRDVQYQVYFLGQVCISYTRFKTLLSPSYLFAICTNPPCWNGNEAATANIARA